jgi:hypothetical protein
MHHTYSDNCKYFLNICFRLTENLNKDMLCVCVCVCVSAHVGVKL